MLSSPNGGIVGFVTNGGWIDGNAADGIRHTLVDEFDHVYVFNLRGNALSSGEQRRREADNIFDSGSRNTVAVTLLVRNQGGAREPRGAQIHYRDIGDYLSRDEKIKIVNESNVATMQWEAITSNDEADWLHRRSKHFEANVALAGSEGIFVRSSLGVVTSRDAWVYGSHAGELQARAIQIAGFVNEEIDRFALAGGGSADDAERFVDRDPKSYSWAANDFGRIARGERVGFDPSMLRTSLYRPFFPLHVFFDAAVNVRQGSIPEFFPSEDATNQLIGVVAHGSRSPFGTLADFDGAIFSRDQFRLYGVLCPLAIPESRNRNVTPR